MLREAGFGVTPVAKLGAEPDAAIGEVGIIEAIGAGDVRLVVNTPTPRSGAVRDAAEIRHAATGEGILCLTAIETAVAAAEALDPAIADRLAEVRLARPTGCRRRARRPSLAGRAGGRRRRRLRVTRRFDLVVFDCDGVLVDSERLSIRLDAELLRELGWELSEDEIVERWVGRTEAAMRRRSRPSSGATSARSGTRSRFATSRRSPRSSSRSTGSRRRSTRSRRRATRRASRRAAASTKIRRNLAKTGLLDRFDGPAVQRRRRRARQARPGPVPPRGGGDGRAAGPDGRRSRTAPMASPRASPPA